MKKQFSQSSGSSGSDFVPTEIIGSTTPIGVKTKSRTTSEIKSQSASAPFSEQIKLALSIDGNGKLLLQSIAGRPPSVASAKRQGLHTVAWATYESMLANALNNHSPATAFCNIIALSDSLLGKDLTDLLIDSKQIDLDAFQEWQSTLQEFIKLKPSAIITEAFIRSAIDGQSIKIFPIIEKAVKAILSNQNLQLGVSYAAIGNIASSTAEGSEIKTAQEQLQQLGVDLEETDRIAKQKPIINKIAESTSKLFHYPFVDEQKEISYQEKQKLIQAREYRSLASFRDNDVNLLAVQLVNLLGAKYNTYPKLMGAEKNKTYPQITEAVVNKIVEDGGWKGAVEVWYKQETGEQKVKDATLFLVARVNQKRFW